MGAKYGQFCPLAKAAELLCERWTMVLVRELVAGSRRFNELRRGVPMMSPTLLSRRLRQLTEAGVVRRTAEPDGTQAYDLTQAGHELRPMVEFMATWGHRWVGSQLEDSDFDAGLLMWDIRRGVDAEQFPNERVVVQIEFSDAPKGWNEWWLISEDGEVDLCLEDPGHEVNLWVHSTLPALTAVWLCRRTIDETERTGELHVSGDRKLRKQLPYWLQGSPLARLGATTLHGNAVTRS